MQINLTNKKGFVLHTAGTFVREDITVGVETEKLNISPMTRTQTFDGLYGTITVGAIPIEQKEIKDLNFSEQEMVNISPTEGKYLTNVAIKKDANLLPGNIRNGTTIFGVVGNLITSDSSDATATASDIAQGKTAYINNEKVEGNVEQVTNKLITRKETTQIVEGSDAVAFLSGTVNKDYLLRPQSKIEIAAYKNKVAEAFGITAEKIAVGNTILGVKGNHQGGGADTSDATAIPEDLLVGKTAYSKDGKIEGAMQKYDGSYTEGASSYSELELSLVSCIDNTMGKNVTKLPSDLTSIGSYGFYHKSSMQITELPDTITEIGQYSFYECTNLALTKLPANLESISNYAFYKCINLKIESIPEKVNSINSYAFNECSGLTEITCYGELNSIGNSAFNKCSNLSKFVLPNVTKVPTLGTTVFANTPIANDLGYIYVPDALVDSFKTATNWSRYETQIKAISEMEV